MQHSTHLLSKLFVVMVAAVIASACQQQGPGATGRQPSSPAGSKTAAARSAEPEVPKIEKPEPVPAKRIVNLLFTSNVAGEVEPCG